MARYDEQRGVWRLTATASRPGQKRRRVLRDFKAPHTPAGAKAAERAELILQAETATKADAAAAYAGTFRSYAERWVDRNRQDWSPGTVEQVEHTLARHVYPHIGTMPLAAPDAPDRIEDMYAAWANHPRRYSKPTRRRWHAMVRAVFSHAIKRGAINVDPMVRVDAAGAATADIPPTVPAKADLEAALAAAPTPAARLFFMLAAYTGARRGSIVSLRWHEVDLEAGTLFFRKTKENNPYTVAIEAQLVAELKATRLRAMETAMALGLGRRLAELYLFSKDGGLTPWNVSWPTHIWRRTADAVGLYDVRLHDLRHFHASHCLAQGISHADVAHRLGCTEANVLRTYSHRVNSDADRRAAQLIEAMFADHG